MQMFQGTTLRGVGLKHVMAIWQFN